MKSTISNIQLTIILWVLLAGMVLLCEIAHGRESFRHDPNIICRQVVVDYTSHPLYGRDCNDLAVVIEQVTGQPWVVTFAAYWMDCHPYDDPVSRCDVNFDGVTDLRDFLILASCRIVYVTPSGGKYHLDWDCRYLTAANRRAILWKDVGKRTVCLECLRRILTTD
jgi:hypothetical protein